MLCDVISRSKYGAFKLIKFNQYFINYFKHFQRYLYFYCVRLKRKMDKTNKVNICKFLLPLGNILNKYCQAKAEVGQIIMDQIRKACVAWMECQRDKHQLPYPSHRNTTVINRRYYRRSKSRY